MMVGGAQRPITPRPGIRLAGWHERAAGDTVSRRVHDELFVKSLAVAGRDGAWILVAADVIGVDPVATERIRAGVARGTGVAPSAILVCATHTHSGPAVSSIASAVDPASGALASRGAETTGLRGERIDGAALHANDVDEPWREGFIASAVATASDAWQRREPAEVAFGEADVTRVASSRRVLLSDGSWADPRRPWPTAATIVHRSTIDPTLRAAFFRRAQDRAPLAAVISYSSHPWVFSTAAISAELPGVLASEFGQTWAAAPHPAPTVLCIAGALGDATPIWNIDIERVWAVRENVDRVLDLERRELGFDDELRRLGRLLAAGAGRALTRAVDWHASPIVQADRRVFTIPLKRGYLRHAAVRLADWQLDAPPGEHRTEVQFLRLGPAGILGLPGEPFAELGRRIREGATLKPVLVAAPANDYGPVSYLAPKDEYALGGYEMTVTPAGPEAGDRLVIEAAHLIGSQAAGAGGARRRP